MSFCRATLQRAISKSNVHQMTSASLSTGKFSKLNMKPSSFPDKPYPTEGKFDIKADKAIFMGSGKPTGWLKQNPVFSEIDATPKLTQEDVDKFEELNLHNARYMEALVTRMIEAAEANEMADMVACTSLFIRQISSRTTAIPLDVTADDEISSLANEVNLLYDSLVADIKLIRRAFDGAIQPHMLLELMRAYNMRPVGVVDRDGFSTEVFDVSSLVNHILVHRDSVVIDAKDGKLNISISEHIQPYTVSSALLATLYTQLMLRNNILSGVVHTPNIGLLYAYDASELPRDPGSHVYSTVDNIVRRPSPPFPTFEQKLKPCTCAKSQCTCLATKDKHVYLDILTNRVGFLPRVADATGVHRCPVSFYSYPAMSLRMLAENLYSTDLHKDGRGVLNVAIKKFEDTIRRQVDAKPDRDEQGRVLVPDSDDELELSRV